MNPSSDAPRPTIPHPPPDTHGSSHGTFPSDARSLLGRLGLAADTAASDTTFVVTPPDAPPQIPGFEILGELGSGGMGVVFQARELALNRVVALKMIRPDARPGTR
ncbi:MAG TPA: hypothetical protein VH092_06320, partial [Urbifossiella sp.]|nr:hypothetical protein [Urbifossiella sp.]